MWDNLDCGPRKHLSTPRDGQARAQAALDGASEVWGLLASTLSNKAVFLPIIRHDKPVNSFVTRISTDFHGLSDCSPDCTL
jgi:hypothetical protein